MTIIWNNDHFLRVKRVFRRAIIKMALFKYLAWPNVHCACLCIHSVCLFYLFLWPIYLELLCVFKIFTSLIFSGKSELRTGRLFVFLLCWVRFGILFLFKKDFLIPWTIILLFFINPFRIKEKVGRKKQVCLYVFHRKYFIEFFT